jgi:hypothetical protein
VASISSGLEGRMRDRAPLERPGLQRRSAEPALRRRNHWATLHKVTGHFGHGAWWIAIAD